MPSIQISVSNKEAVALGSPLIICGNNDYTIDFTFDAEWDDLPVKTARFTYTKDGVPAYIDKPFSGSTVEVPVLSGLSLVEVGVFAGDLRTTTGARIPCKRSILCAGAVPQEEPPADLYNEVLQECNEAIARNEHTKEELVRGGLVENLKETNDGKKFSFWVGTQAEYDALPEKDGNTLYLLSDETTEADIEAALNDLSNRVSVVENKTGLVKLYDYTKDPTSWQVGQSRTIPNLNNYNIFIIKVGGQEFLTTYTNKINCKIYFSNLAILNLEAVTSFGGMLQTESKDSNNFTFMYYRAAEHHVTGEISIVDRSNQFITEIYALGGF